MPKFILVPKPGQDDFEVSDGMKEAIIKQCEIAILTMPYKDEAIIPSEIFVEMTKIENGQISFQMKLMKRLTAEEMN